MPDDLDEQEDADRELFRLVSPVSHAVDLLLEEAAEKIKKGKSLPAAAADVTRQALEIICSAERERLERMIGERLKVRVTHALEERATWTRLPLE